MDAPACYEPDRLFASKKLLQSVKDESFYLYFAEGIRSRTRRLLAAFSWNPENRCFFPVKANANPEILRMLLEEGLGLLCTSAVELCLAVSVGASGDQILFAPVAADEKDWAEACRCGARLSLDRPEAVRLLALAGPLPEEILLRVQPQEPIRVGAKIVVKPENSKFGMAPQLLPEVARQLEKLGVKRLGFHVHLTGYLSEIGYWAALAEYLWKLAQTIQKKSGMSVSCLHLGGGLASGGRPEEQFPEIEEVAERIRAKLLRSGETIPVETAFGSWLLGENGLYLTRVKAFREDEPLRPILFVAGSAFHVGDLLLKRSYHHISIVGKETVEGRVVCSVAGACSDQQDFLGKRRLLPVPASGDLLAVHHTGAYGYSMALNLPGQPLCREYLLENGRIRCI